VKKSISLALLFFFTVPGAITSTWLQYQKYLTRAEVKTRLLKGMERKDLLLLGLTHEESQNVLTWEDEKEFEYRGHMYDVVETQFTSDSVYFWCWSDDDETDLNEKIAGLIEAETSRDPSRRETEKRLEEFSRIPFELLPYAVPSGKDSPGEGLAEDPLTDLPPSCHVPLVPPPKSGLTGS